jgi:di/tricarboxylate transporter
LTPRSRLEGRSLQDARFRSRYGVTVLALMRRGEKVEENIAEVPLRFGDTLLVEGTWQDIESLTQEHEDFIVVGQPRELTERFHSRHKAAIALTIMVAMLVAMTLEIVPAVSAVLLAAVAMVLSGSVRPRDFYASINWESVVLIAAMLPMATALEKSGGVQFVADTLTHNLGAWGPLAIMAGLFLITSFFSQFISNTATTVLVAPIAARTALELGIDPHAFLMAVALSASTAFATPIASPVNTLVLGPGDYRFSDFARIGVPLQVLVLTLVMLLVPLFFPM